MDKKYYNEITDHAWKKLHNRLEEDGLLNTPQPIKRNIISMPAIKWAASLIVIGISIAVIALVVNNNKNKIEFLTLNNTENTSSLVSTLADGSIVYLGGQASLSFPTHFEQDKREVFLEGNALFDVKGNKKCPFIIETEKIRIEVLGTTFDVKSTNGFSLSVLSGRVKATTKSNNRSVFIERGETAFMNEGQLQVKPSDDAGLKNFYTDQIRFKDEPLSNIITIMNKNSEGPRLEISPELAGRKITVSFFEESNETIARLICYALNLEYSVKPDKIYISQKNN